MAWSEGPAQTGAGEASDPTVSVDALPPDVAWTADAEQPVEQEWAGLSCLSLDRIRRVEWPRAQGSHAYEVTVRDGDSPEIDEERCELTQGRHYRLPGTTVPVGERTFARGDEHWIAFQVRVGDDWNADTPLFNNIMQLKNHGNGGPPLKMAIDEGRIELGGIDRSYQSAPNFLTLWSTPFAPDLRNRWLRFLLHVRFDFDSDGFVELYGDLDGRGTVALMPRTHTPTMKRNDDGPLPSHARLGIYRDADVAGTARIWFDGYVVAETRSAAEAVAFPGAAAGDRAAPHADRPLGAQRPRRSRARDSVSPALRVRGIRGRRLRGAVYGRMVVRASCDEPCRLRARLVLTRTAARRLRIGRRDVVIGRGATRGFRRGVVSARLRVPASRATRRRMLGARAVHTRLVLDVVDRAGNRTVRRRELTLR